MDIRKALIAIVLALPLHYCFSMEYSLQEKQTYSLVCDLDAMYKHSIEDHPGSVNPLDPNFRSNLDISYKTALASIQEATNLEAQKQTLEHFARSFKDGHVWVSWKIPSSTTSPTTHTIETDAELTIQETKPGIAVITLPTFHFVDGAQKEQLATIAQRLPYMQNYTSIIFDIRGNKGGNSAYGSHIINALFGKEYAMAHRKTANAQVAVDWKVSAGNIEHIKMLCAQYNIKAFEAVAQGMKQALDNGQNYYRTSSGKFQGHDLNSKHHNVAASITVIIDNSNGSAALDFIDELKMMNYPLTLVGKTTKADRLYMEVRTVDLPSGLGTFSFPIKVYRNRIRGDNEPYTPDIKLDTSDPNILQKIISSTLV